MQTDWVFRQQVNGGGAHADPEGKRMEAWKDFRLIGKADVLQKWYLGAVLFILGGYPGFTQHPVDGI